MQQVAKIFGDVMRLSNENRIVKRDSEFEDDKIVRIGIIGQGKFTKETQASTEGGGFELDVGAVNRMASLDELDHLLESALGGDDGAGLGEPHLLVLTGEGQHEGGPDDREADRLVEEGEGQHRAGAVEQRGHHRAMGMAAGQADDAGGLVGRGRRRAP